MSCASILVVEDDTVLRQTIERILKGKGYKVYTAINGDDALFQLHSTPVDLVLSDIKMDGMTGDQLLKNIKKSNCSLPIVLMTAYGRIESAVTAIRDGAQDYLQKPFSAEKLLHCVSKYVQKPRTEDDPNVVCEDPASKDLYKLAMKVADSNLSVLILGESGTGKEVLARFLHEKSSRNRAPFVALNCAAIPETMLEATMFGYNKGAFTGAIQNTPGKFEIAQGGTLLLMKYQKWTSRCKQSCLRVLQEKEVERLGSQQKIKLDVRILATSNRHLFEEVKAGKFREDLFYRLSVFPITIQPLRERTGDILALSKRFLDNYSKEYSRHALELSAEAMEMAGRSNAYMAGGMSDS